MATFTGHTRFLVALLVVVSTVIMGCSVDVCHGAREGGTFPRVDPSARRPDGYIPTTPGGAYIPTGPRYPTIPMPRAPGGHWPRPGGTYEAPLPPRRQTDTPQNGEIPQP
ncbi:hypothetical protein E2562_022635 [Oryza meyeriana var. granulata]|uniref:Uncharacterized protein n=1 Tax=Oryza meyeriana var. granulata TaxID=110450 RepID=A0A6G1CSB6_9ORYZ|nr:hypothetical protein E2562_022635 [Oryza meyeriana var. granulata]